MNDEKLVFGSNRDMLEDDEVSYFAIIDKSNGRVKFFLPLDERCEEPCSDGEHVIDDDSEFILGFGKPDLIESDDEYYLRTSEMN